MRKEQVESMAASNELCLVLNERRIFTMVAVVLPQRQRAETQAGNSPDPGLPQCPRRAPAVRSKNG